MIKEVVTDVEKLSNRIDEMDIRKHGQEIRSTIINLKDTVRANNYTGLSAPQIGDSIRAFVINFNGDIRSYCNPMIIKVDAFSLSREKDECFPDKEYILPRYSKVTMAFQTPLGEAKSQEFIGMAAQVVQRYIDHLEGILISDLGLEIDSDFDEATEEEREELIKAYLDSMDVRVSELKEEIENDENLKKLDDAFRFDEALKSGKITLEDRPLTDEEKAYIEEEKKKVNNE